MMSMTSYFPILVGRFTQTPLRADRHHDKGEAERRHLMPVSLCALSCHARPLIRQRVGYDKAQTIRQPNMVGLTCLERN
jgi:hypothetical protein